MLQVKYFSIQCSLLYLAHGLALPMFSARLAMDRSSSLVGIALALGSLGLVIAHPVFGALSDRIGYPRAISLAGAINIVSAAGLIVLEGVSLVLVAGAYLITAVSISFLFDAMIVSRQSEQFGRIRLWGSVGFLVGSGLAGFFYQALLPHVMIVIYIGVFTVFLLLVLARAPSQCWRGVFLCAENARQSESPSLWKNNKMKWRLATTLRDVPSRRIQFVINENSFQLTAL